MGQKYKHREARKSLRKAGTKRHQQKKVLGKLHQKRGNRHDDDNSELSGATVSQLVEQVKSAKAVPVVDELLLNSRALVDSMLQKDVETGKQVLRAEPVLSAAATLEGISDDEGACNDEKETAKNGYCTHGPPYAFWKGEKLHASILKSLQDLGFTHPTPVQQEVLPVALRFPLHKDIVVSAETGSGKTLVFALPIIQSVLSRKLRLLRKSDIDGDSRKRKRVAIEELEAETAADEGRVPKPDVLHSLIITPTRELALQIKTCMQQLCKHTKLCRVGCVVGGMAPEKQQRVLNMRPDVLICTPGRVWDLIAKNEGCFLGHSVSRRLSFLVLDEADRLLQSGRFQDLKNILERIQCELLPATVENDIHSAGEGVVVRFDPATKSYVPATEAVTKVASGSRDALRPSPMPIAPPKDHRVITFVTSATLSLQTNYERKDIKSRHIIRTSNASTMNKVLSELGLRQKNVEKFNLTPGKSGITAKLQETFMRCPENTKDLYLYYFLRRYTERTIVFVNAISMLRRLAALLTHLGIPVCALHASMQQRQRLKFIDKFRSGEKRVLVATDIASRGLDIEGVRYIVHYQIPRSTDAYVHRCGRTARCGGTGFSVMMVSAAEHLSFKKLNDSLGRTAPMEVFGIDHTAVHKLRPHLVVAAQIDKLTKEITKTSANQRWVKTTGEAVEIDAEDMMDDTLDEQNREKKKAIKILTARLNAMTRRDLDVTAKGAFLSAPKAIGASAATVKIRQRGDRQAFKKR